MKSNRTIAFLDILGFKRKIDEEPLDILSSKYERLIDITEMMNRPIKFSTPPPQCFSTLSHNVNVYRGNTGQEICEPPSLFPDHPQNEPWCIRQVFSDSIFLVSNSSDETDALKTIIYAWRLSQSLIALGMPARGGISFGEIFLNLSKNIMLGKGLTQAYQLESKQQWVGIAIDEVLKEAFPNLYQAMNDPHDLLSLVCRRYPVPFKDGTTKELNTLNWRFNLVADLGTKLLFSEEKTGDIGEKIANTLLYAKSFVDSGKTFAYGDGVPTELRMFCIGAKEPPFKHGDDH